MSAAGGLVLLSGSASAAPPELKVVHRRTDAAERLTPLDLTKVAFGQQGRELIWSLSTREAWHPRQLSRERSLCLLLQRRGADSTICVLADRRRPHELQLRAATRMPDGRLTLGRRIAGRVRRADRHSLSARFDPEAAGLAVGRYRWSVRSRWTAAGCRSPDGAQPEFCEDAVPDAGTASARRYAVHLAGCERSRRRYWTGGPQRGRVVALTFDDGPSSYSAPFMRLLERKQVPATFFVVGQEVVRSPGLVRWALAHGFMVGNHSWSHPQLAAAGAFARAQLASTQRAIRQAAGFTPCLFRAPYGQNSAALLGEAHAMGMTTIQWNVDPRDWSLPGTAAIVSRVTSAVHPGSIVVMHDGGGSRAQTLAALPHIIDTLRQRGYRFETVTQLLGLREIYAGGSRH